LKSKYIIKEEGKKSMIANQNQHKRSSKSFKVPEKFSETPYMLSRNCKWCLKEKKTTRKFKRKRNPWNPRHPKKWQEAIWKESWGFVRFVGIGTFFYARLIKFPESKSVERSQKVQSMNKRIEKKTTKISDVKPNKEGTIVAISRVLSCVASVAKWINERRGGVRAIIHR